MGNYHRRDNLTNLLTLDLKLNGGISDKVMRKTKVGFVLKNPIFVE